MSLSLQWSQPVVVRADSKGAELVSQQAPTSSSARAYAASGNPIVVRERDPQVLSVSTSGSSTTDSSRGGIVSLFVRPDVSETFWVPDAARNEMGLLETLHRRGAANRTHVLLQSRPLLELRHNFSTCTNMNIDLSHNAFRLSKTAMALRSVNAQLGSDDEDGSNAYNDAEEQFVDEQTGEVFYCEDGQFYPVGSGPRKQQRHRGSSRHGASSVSSSPSSSSPGRGSRVSMSTKGFKTALRASLQSLQEEDYYVVKYRDYSAWAITQYRSISRSDSLFGKKYVEQCFAVHVGREPGELIPITESQFLYAVDTLQRQLLNQLEHVGKDRAGARGDANQNTYLQYQTDINYSALNADQFRALGAIIGDGLRSVGVEFEEKKRAEEAERRAHAHGPAGRPYDAPAWYDWSPGAVRRRVQHQLETYYVSVGRLVVQVTVIGLVGFFAYRAVRDYLPSLGGRASAASGATDHDYDDDRRGGARRGRRPRRTNGSGSSRGYYDDDEGEDGAYGYVRRSLLRSIFMGPKEVMDYVLAPDNGRG